MGQNVEEYVRPCRKCNKLKIFTKDKAPVPMKITIPLPKPFQKITLDIVGPLPKTHAGNQYILTFQLGFSQ